MIFNRWRALTARPSSQRPRDCFGRLMPFNAELEEIAGKYSVWRAGPADHDGLLARRTALAICEAIEKATDAIAVMQSELDIVLDFER